MCFNNQRMIDFVAKEFDPSLAHQVDEHDESKSNLMLDLVAAVKKAVNGSEAKGPALSLEDVKTVAKSTNYRCSTTGIRNVENHPVFGKFLSLNLDRDTNDIPYLVGRCVPRAQFLNFARNTLHIYQSEENSKAAATKAGFDDVNQFTDAVLRSKLVQIIKNREQVRERLKKRKLI